MITASIPEIKPVASIQVTEPEVHELDNGIVVYGFNGSPNEIIKLDLIFNAGRWQENHPLTAGAASALIKSGTVDESAYEIEARIDHLGSTIKASAGYNGFTLSVYCMTRHLEECLKVFNQILHRCSFPDEEVELHKLNSLSRFKVNLLKNDYVGDMIFKEMLFGAKHPYGYRTTADMIESLNSENIRAYYSNKLGMGNCHIGLAGNFESSDLDLLNKYLGQRENWASKSEDREEPEWEADPSTTKKMVKHLKDSVQASIYIGGPVIGRTHEDYQALSMINLIYGGYFGSRLMKNIREEKGLTYGIYSYMQQYKHAATLIVNTDTAVEYLDQCLHEIYAEMERLRQQPVGDKELGKARNYMIGRLLDQVDGPFKSAGTFLGLKSHNIPLSFVKDTEQALKDLTAEELMAAAAKYFDKEVMYEVVVK